MLNLIRARLSRDQLMAFSLWVCVRSRVVEDLVQRALSQGLQQYVIVGAGLDSFAYRRVDLLDQLRVFEVDHPASQRWKRQRLEQLSIPTPKSLVFAPVDFESQSLVDGLVASGFEGDAPAVFSWIGVTMYLTTDAIRKTLRAVASCGHGSQIVLTYNQPASILDALSRTVADTPADTIGQSGEPFI